MTDLKIYDVSTDEYRIATQADIKGLQDAVQRLGFFYAAVKRAALDVEKARKRAPAAPSLDNSGDLP